MLDLIQKQIIIINHNINFIPTIIKMSNEEDALKQKPPDYRGAFI